MKNFLKILSVLLAVLISVCMLASCGGEEAQTSATEEPGTDTSVDTGNESETDENGEVYVTASDSFTKFDTRISYENEVNIVLKDDGTTADGEGVTINGNVVTVTAAGSYVLSGTLSDGQIIVEVDKLDKVQLVFKGVDITCSNSSPLYIKSADKVAITLEKGTENYLTDGKSYTNQNEDGEPNSCIFSKDDLTINGYGSLTVTGNSNNGISTKNDFKMVSGNVTVKAVNNGIKGKDSISINSGTLVVSSDDDGLKTTEDDNDAKGYILIEGGNITIKSGDDALTAITGITITGGTVTSYALGKSVNCLGKINITTGCLVEK